MKKILLATDLSEKSDRAMERALQLTKETEAKLHIIHVEPLYAYPKKKSAKAYMKPGKEDLIGMFLDAHNVSRLDVTVNVLKAAEPFAEILGYARKIRADLIVMGMHNKEKFRDLFVGTTIERVVRKGAAPVLMVKNRKAHSYRRVLTATDFAPGSRAALRLAMELAPKASFQVIHATEIQPVPYLVSTYDDIEERSIAEEQEEKTLDSFIRTESAYFKKEHGGESKVTGRIIQGDPYEVLAKQVDMQKADLIAIGAHGRFGLALSRLGGVAEDILARPPCDVLVARG